MLAENTGKVKHRGQERGQGKGRVGKKGEAGNNLDIHEFSH